MTTIMTIEELAAQQYKLNEKRSRRKDKVVIFANSDFGQKAGFADLAWVKSDYAAMNDYWSYYEIIPQLNKTRGQMQATIKQLSKDVSADSSCLVLIFLTYGDHGLIYGTDTEPIALQKLLAPLKGDKCLNLAGKPKILILQTSVNTLQSDADTSPTKEYTIPSEADFIYLWSRLPGHRFVKNPMDGSLFINKLVRALEDHQGEQLTTVMRRTIGAVEDHLKAVDQTYLDKTQELPFMMSQLRKRLIIP